MGDAAYIPGSSLRGVLRSTVERLMVAVRPNEEFCIALEDVSKAEKASRRCSSHQPPEELDGKKEYQLSFCPICRLFGSTAIASRLKISDALQTGLKPKEPVRRDGVGIDRDTETTRDQIKYDFEVLEPGPAFRVMLQVENAGETDRALLHMMLVEFKNGVDVGGKRSRGLGRVVLEPDYKVRYFDEDGEYKLGHYLENGGLSEMEPVTFDANLKAAFRHYVEAGQGGTYVAARVA
jgi:CRISPR-associated RAMP protein (TIGR02581 family)